MLQQQVIMKHFRRDHEHVVCLLCSRALEADTTFRDAWEHLKFAHDFHGETTYHGPRPSDPLVFAVKVR